MKETHLSALCIVGAVILAAMGVKDWFWLVFVAVMLAL